MNKATKLIGSSTTMLAAAAFSGLIAGAARRGAAQTASAETSAARTAANSAGTMGMRANGLDTHACKGMNACKGEGGCKSSDNGCKGKNSCKGKGGCRTDTTTTKPSTLRAMNPLGRAL